MGSHPVLSSLAGASALALWAAIVGRGRPGSPVATFMRAGAIALTGKSAVAVLLRR